MGDIDLDRVNLKVELESVRRGWKEDKERLRGAELEVGELRSVLSDAVRGSCPICNVGGNSDLQNHHQDCEAGKLVAESRSRVPTQPCICGLSAARCPIHE